MVFLSTKIAINLQVFDQTQEFAAILLLTSIYVIIPDFKSIGRRKLSENLGFIIIIIIKFIYIALVSMSMFKALYKI